MSFSEPMEKLETFGGWLRAAMTERDLSARALGRLLEPDAPERGRRNVLRYLNTGISPRKEMRARIAKALGITPSEMPADDSEEDE